jgi:glycosyltransferase involved in cell wall biosynthesis
MATFAKAGNQAPSLSYRHVLHVFPSFGVGGVPLRMVRIINHFGKRFRHTVVALDNNFEAAGGLAGDLDLVLSPVRALKRGTLQTVLDGALVLRRMRPDLLITYNWGAIEWAMANRLWPYSRHIHIEAGFSQREADSQIPHRVLFRRWALARCALIVVPSRLLEDVARRIWRLPPERVRYVPNGVDVARFSSPARDVWPGFAATRRTRNRDGGALAPREECRAPPAGIRNPRYFDYCASRGLG